MAQNPNQDEERAMSVTRTAIIKRRDGTPAVETVEAYLPANYHVSKTGTTSGEIVIHGEDNAGWTLDGYVIPRLASGLIFAEEAPR
jgi:hypothetical protein